MYNFDEADADYSLPHDIGGQAALNDFNRALFNAFAGFEDEDAAWRDMRKSEFGEWLYQRIMEFDEYDFNGTAKEE